MGCEQEYTMTPYKKRHEEEEEEVQRRTLEQRSVESLLPKETMTKTNAAGNDSRKGGKKEEKLRITRRKPRKKCP